MKTGGMSSPGETLRRVDVAPGRVVFQFSCCTSSHPPATQGFFLFIQTGGCRVTFALSYSPLKRGVCAFIFTGSPFCWLFSRGSGGNPALRHKSSFQTISEASKGDKGAFDKPPSSAVFSQVQGKKLKNFISGFPVWFSCPCWRFPSNFKNPESPQSRYLCPFSWAIRWCSMCMHVDKGLLMFLLKTSAKVSVSTGNTLYAYINFLFVFLC